jgi:sugar phosphate permease
VQVAAIALVQVLGLATWFSAAAVVGELERVWSITATEAAWLTASTQVGFVLGALASAAANLSDRFPPQRLLAFSAAAAGITNLLLAWVAHGLAPAVVLRFLTGVFLAGVYPVGLKLMTTWAPTSSRGRLIGLLIAALTLGSALPHLLGSFDGDWRVVVSAASASSLLAAIVSTLVIREGPQSGSAPFVPDWRFMIRMLRDRQQRLVNFAYAGHMWELYALWAWGPVWALLIAPDAGRNGMGLPTFLAIGVAGVVGCLVGGWTSDRYGRALTATVALAVSSGCCLSSPVAAHFSPLVLFAFAATWGAAVIADSGVYSTLLSELVDSRYIGTALTAQMAIGYLVTTVSMQLVPLAASAAGWPSALIVLAAGPIAGLIFVARFSSLHARKAAVSA